MLHKKRILPAVMASMALSSCVRQRVPLVETVPDSPLLRPVPPRAETSPKQELKGLVLAIKFGDDDERLRAGKRLVEASERHALPILLDALWGENPDVQFFSALSLHKLDDARAVPRIMEIAVANHPRKVELIRLLGDFGDARAVPMLESNLEGDDPACRAASAEALGKLKSVSSLEKLMALARDRDGSVRNAAVKSLGALADPAASDRLITALSDKAAYVRASAIDALGKIGEPAIERLFDAIVAGNPDYRQECLESLIAMGPTAVPSLVEALRHSNGGTLKPYIIRALGNIGDPSASGAIILALDDEDPLVRGDGANALRMLKSHDALPALISLAQNDPSEFVRAASGAAVRSIRGE